MTEQRPKWSQTLDEVLGLGIFLMFFLNLGIGLHHELSGDRTSATYYVLWAILMQLFMMERSARLRRKLD